MKKTLIIAEAGVNHNGNIETAKKLVVTARECGADIIKFQTFDVNSLVSKYAVMADYQKKNLGMEDSDEALQKGMLSKLALTFQDFRMLADYCSESGIRFLSTPFDIKSIHFLDEIQAIWKIPSGEINNYPYLVEIARTGKDIILSTGMSRMEEVDEALKVLRENGAGKITLLHCTTNYPTPMEEVNLKAMLTLKEHCGCPVGYSDHTRGIEVAIAAAALGAEVIEKHFTLDRNMAGPDHKASLEPGELKAMVQAIRNIEIAVGDGRKEPSGSETANIAVVRKSIVAAREIREGELLTEENLTTKRPGNGINPMRWNEILGRKAKRNFLEDELIEL